MIATVLDGDEAPDMAEKARWNDLRSPRGQVGEARDLVAVSYDPIDFRHLREGVGIQLRCATCDEDAGVRSLAPAMPDCLAGLAHRLVCDCAAVDDDPVFVRFCEATDRLALREVQPAAERDRLDAHANASRSISPLKT